MNNKKVLQVVNTLTIAGAEKLVVDIAIAMKNKNCSCDVLIFKELDNKLKQDLIKNNINLIVLSNTKSVYSISNIFKLIPIIKKYDIVHVHLFPAQYYVAIASILSFSKAKLITTEHSTNNKRRNKWFLKPFEKLVYNLYDNIICISDKSSSILIDYLRSSKKITTISNGIHTAQFANAAPIDRNLIGLNNDDFIITMVARFVPIKEQDVLIKALTHLPKKVKLVLVGGGMQKQNCEQLANSLNVTDRVKFLGIRNDVAQILKTSDVIAMSSSYEGMSLSSLEGMCVNKPFIASNVPGLTEVVKEAGLLFERGDDKQFANCITELMNNKQYYNQIAQACLERASQYDINFTLNKLFNLYNASTNA